MINWKVRFKNKYFWLQIIPAIGLLLTQVAQLCGVTIDITEYTDQLIVIVGTVFAVLNLIGAPVDTTTAGYGDSAQALEYDSPRGD